MANLAPTSVNLGPPTSGNLEKNLRAIYVHAFFSMFLIVIPIIVPWFASLGLTMKQVYEVQAIFGLAVAMLEIPTGYISDLWGRKNSLLLGGVFYGIGCSLMLVADSYWDVIAFELTLALAISLMSGADLAILYDSVKGRDQDRSQGTRALANFQLAMVLGEAVAAVAGGLLVAFSFRHVLVAQAIAGWMPLLCALVVREPPVERLGAKPGQQGHLQNFRQVFHHLLGSHDRLLRLTFVNLVVWSVSTMIAVWAYQKNWEDAGVPVAWFGAIWAIYLLVSGWAGKQVHTLERRFGASPILLFVGLGPILGYALLAFATDRASILAIGLLFYLSRGTGQVLLREALNWRVPSEFRATANSMASFAFRLSFAAVGPIVGWSIDRQGLRPTYLWVGVAFLGLFVVFLLPLVRQVRALTIREIPVEPAT